jgi:hypothetical protein
MTTPVGSLTLNSLQVNNVAKIGQLVTDGIFTEVLRVSSLETTTPPITAANVGIGEGHVLAAAIPGPSSSTALEFKTLKEGQNITISDTPDTIIISAASDATTGANQGTGTGKFFKDEIDNQLNFRSLQAGSANVTITTEENDVKIAIAGDATTGANQGIGSGEVFRDKTGDQLNFRTLLAGSNVTITTDTTPDTVTINSIDATTATNVGTGSGLVFQTEVGDELRFRRLLQGSNVTITTGADDVTIDATDPTTGANQGTGAGLVFRDKTGDTLNFRQILAGTNVTVTTVSDDVKIDAAGSGITGPGTSTDGAIVLWDGLTGTALRQSAVVPAIRVNYSTNDIQNGNTIELKATTNQITTGTGLNATTSNYPASAGGAVLQFPNVSTTIATTNTTQTFSNKTFSDSLVTTATSNQLITGTGGNLTTSTYPASSGAVTLTFPNVTTTIATTNTAQTLSNKTFSDSLVTTATTNQLLTGTGGNVTTSNYPASAGAVTLTFPNVTTTIATTDTVQTFSNKTISDTLVFTAASNPIRLQPGDGANTSLTLTAANPATASRIVTFPDPGADAKVIYDVQTQSLSGAKTFSSVVTASAGINFGGSTLATFVDKTAWTPALAFAGSSAGINYTSQNGTYSRIGNIVFIGFSINLQAPFTPTTGAATLTGLPITVASVNQPTGAVNGFGALTLQTNYTCVAVFPVQATTTAQLNKSSKANENYATLQDTDFTATTALRGEFFYFV